MTDQQRALRLVEDLLNRINGSSGRLDLPSPGYRDQDALLPVVADHLADVQKLRAAYGYLDANACLYLAAWATALLIAADRAETARQEGPASPT
jgi:hypothetical protein